MNYFIQNLYFEKLNDVLTLDQHVQQILDNLKLVNENVAENKAVAQQKQKQNYDKNLKKRKVEVLKLATRSFCTKRQKQKKRRFTETSF